MRRDMLLSRLEQACTDLHVVPFPFVVVGGATMPLYVDAASLSVVRETEDIDVMVEATNYAAFTELEERLRAEGFRQDVLGSSPRCRWFKGDLQYDIVDVRTDHPMDRWARPTGPGIEQYTLPSGQSIPVLCPGRFMAAKIAALYDRGGSHWYESPDFEDLILLLESHADLPAWLAETPEDAAAVVALWARTASQRTGIREEIEATVTRGPDANHRCDLVFRRLLWLSGWRT